MDQERTESDKLRVTRSIAGASGGKSKILHRQPEALTTTPQASASKCHIAVAIQEQKQEQKQEQCEPFNHTHDGSLAFENTMALYPTEKRDYSTLVQTNYFQAIHEIREVHKCTSAEAVARLDKHIQAYVARRGEFCVGFLKYLDSKPWKVATVAAPVRDEAKEQAELQAFEDKCKRENRERRARDAAEKARIKTPEEIAAAEKEARRDYAAEREAALKAAQA